MVLDALFYRLRNAGPWRDLPEGFGPWRTIYGWYRRWAREGLWGRMLARLSRKVKNRIRLVDDRAAVPSIGFAGSLHADTLAQLPETNSNLVTVPVCDALLLILLGWLHSR
jgi:transposase